MYRRIVLSFEAYSGAVVDILYHAHGAVLLSQARVSTRGYDSNFKPLEETGVCVFSDSVRLKTSAPIGTYRTYEFILDVSEDQPTEEAVEEITTTGVGIDVYNEHGVLVCRNTPKTPSNSDPSQTVTPGEMTSVPGEEPGETTSELVDGPGAMI